ncbi:MAG: hypothetical protein P8Z37_01010 [Acidobacteriota bacterium]
MLRAARSGREIGIAIGIGFAVESRSRWFRLPKVFKNPTFCDQSHGRLYTIGLGSIPIPIAIPTIVAFWIVVKWDTPHSSNRCEPQDLSNFYCIPGTAGGPPVVG